MKWSQSEIKILKNNFSNTRNKDLVKLFNNRTIKSITMLANKMGLKKDPAHKSKVTAHRNKLVGRNLTHRVLTDIATKYNTRAEFQHTDGSAYQTARRKGILDTICKHMIPQSYSIPQLILNDIITQVFGNTIYNDRTVIKPLELDVYLPKYKVAFEYDGKGWHNGINHTKISKCHNASITLFILVENHRKYEVDIKGQLCLILDDLNKLCDTSVTTTMIHDIKIDYTKYLYNNKKIKDICASYIYVKNFREAEPYLYNKLSRLKLLSLYTVHMKRFRHVTWNISNAKSEIKKYEVLCDFIKYSSGCYQYIRRHNLSYLLDTLN